MSSIPLSEQMGAMALVDELRHQQKQVQEHLDLPRRRAEIAEHIRSYYQNHNIAFDDNLIEQGVRQVFARRLLLEMPPVGAIDTWLINTLVRRSGVIKTLRTSAMVLLGIAFVVYKFTSPTVYSPAEVSEISTDAAIVRDDRKKLFREVDKQRGAVEALARRLAEQPDPQASVLLQRARSALPATDVRTSIGLSEPVTSANAAAIEVRVKELEEGRYAVNRSLYDVEGNVKYAGRILDTRNQLKEMLQDPKFALGIAHSSNLDQRLAEVDQLLKQVTDYDSAQEASTAYNDLRSDLWSYEQDMLELQSMRYRSLKERITSRRVPDEIRPQLRRKVEVIHQFLEAGDSAAAERKINHLISSMKDAGYWRRWGGSGE
ncbi:DUF6384 family protein [Pseudomonas sp. NPDC087817]|uniref:DUF6384 family protein n=1 Tax=Pseudomonas sp. NPDC087817 TaxID=3364451 RepID=UPI00380826B0